MLWSCESDEISSLPEQHSSTTNFKITTLNSEQISKNEKVKEILKKSKKYENSLKAKSVANYQGFYIDTSFSKYVESSDGTQHSYTFLIDRNNNTLENLLLSSNNQGGYNTYIVSYGFSSQEKSNMNFNDFSSKEVIIKPIDFNASQIIINIQAKTQQLVCIDSQTQVKVGCCGGDLCRGDSSACISNGGTGYYYEWVTTSSTCEWVAPGGDNDSNSTTDGEPTSTSGGDSSTTTVLIDTTPYTTDLKQFVSGTLNLATEGVKSYYTSDNNIYNTINNYLIQKGFSDFSKFEAMLNLEFGFSLGLNPQSFVWAFNNKESEEVKAVKDFLAVNITTEAKAFALKAINNKSTKYINENFEFTKKSPFNVDMTQVLDSIKLPTINPENKIAAEKFKCIYDKVTKSPKFKDLFIDLFGTNKDINVTFEIADDFVTKPDGTQTNGNCKLENYSLNTDGSIKTANAKIKINKNKLTATSMQLSNILMAKTIVHESIHAFLSVKRKDCNAGLTIDYLNNLEFKELIEEYYDGTCATKQEQHEFMFDYMVPTLSKIFTEVRDDLIPQRHIDYAESTSFDILGTSTDWDWQDFYYYSSLGGLHETESFKNEIKNISLKYELYKHYRDEGKLFDKSCNN
uniref:SprT-like domain-containing protein n=1 Tax=Tenacibaculum sp. Pbs-1 TaxID=3238748 RepID=A0AB33KT90_9FLAO